MEGSSCDKIQDMLFDYLDNELSEADRNTVEDHTEKCEKCRKELETRRKLLQLISDSAYYPKSELAAAFSGNQALLKNFSCYNLPEFDRKRSVEDEKEAYFDIACACGFGAEHPFQQYLDGRGP